MMANYNQLIADLDEILKNVGNVSGMKLMYNAIKQDSDARQKQEFNQMESSFSHLIDPFYQTKTFFTQWLIQSDVYLRNTNFEKNIFLKRFLKQREKTENELDKAKPETTVLNSLLTNLRMHLQALEQFEKRVNPLVTVKEIEDKTNSNIEILEQGKPYEVFKVIGKIFSQSEKYIKLMERWISIKTLDYFVSTRDVSIMILTTEIENTVAFETILKRINEERDNKIDIRKCDRKDFHDRYIITDKELWSLGPSLKDAGYKTWGTITRADDEEKRDEINQKFDDLWKKAE